jgi:hypothetical protein
VTRRIPEPDPRSELEDEGIPDLSDSAPEQERAEDPQQAPVPGDQPVAVNEFGTTAEEQREGESLEDRLGREEPEPPEMQSPAVRAQYGAAPQQRPDGAGRSGRLVVPSQGFGPDREADEVATDVGPDRGGYSAEEEAMRVEPDSG